MGGGSGDDDSPPAIVLVLGTILGLVTLWAIFSIVQARRRGAAPARPMVLTVVITRALSALLGIPALFADIDAGIKVVVAVSVVLTVVGLALIRPELDEAQARA